MTERKREREREREKRGDKRERKGETKKKNQFYPLLHLPPFSISLFRSFIFFPPSSLPPLFSYTSFPCFSFLSVRCTCLTWIFPAAFASKNPRYSRPVPGAPFLMLVREEGRKLGEEKEEKKRRNNSPPPLSLSLSLSLSNTHTHTHTLSLSLSPSLSLSVSNQYEKYV